MTTETHNDAPAMTSEFVTEHQEMVTIMSRRHHKDSHIFTMEDVAQEIWLHMARNWEYVKNKTAYQIEGFAHRAAAKFCRDQREKFMYFTGAFLYTPEDVKRILNDCVWTSELDVNDVAGKVDLQGAFNRLDREPKRALFRYFALGETVGLTDAKRKMVQRTVDRLTHILNGNTRLTASSVEEEYHQALAAA